MILHDIAAALRMGAVHWLRRPTLHDRIWRLIFEARHHQWWRLTHEQQRRGLSVKHYGEHADDGKGAVDT